MAEVQPYYAFVQAHAQDTQAELLAAVDVPCLYFPGLPDLALTDQFKTIRFTPNRGVPADVGQQGIVPLRKSHGNAFNMMITMGRAKNNDLVIPDQRVSKFHVYFRNVGDEWRITDANSTNGTSVDGVNLETTQQSVTLRSNSRIVLSEAIEVLFLEPADVYAMLQDAKAWVL